MEMVITNIHIGGCPHDFLHLYIS